MFSEVQIRENMNVGVLMDEVIGSLHEHINRFCLYPKCYRKALKTLAKGRYNQIFFQTTCSECGKQSGRREE